MTNRDNQAVKTTGIARLKLTPLDPDRPADVALASIPLPHGDHAAVGFDGMPSQAVPIAWHPAEQGAGPGKPRQVLVMGVADGAVPDSLGLVTASDGTVVNVQPVAASVTRIPGWTGPTWRTDVVEEKKTGLMMREVNELVIEHAGRRLGIRMGIEMAGGGFHWWEWLQVEQLWTGPVCTAIRAAGYIGVTALSEEELFNRERYNTGEWLHKHNWLYAEVYAQVFVNGLVRITARHVNNRFFDQGRDLAGFVPVTAFTMPGLDLPETVLDGTTTELRLGDETTGVYLDLDRCADLVSPEHPGLLRAEGALAICRPYEGTEYDRGASKAHGGDNNKDLRQPAERWQIAASEQRMWKGMARSFGFDLSFAERPIRTRRYLPSRGWMGHAGALWPDGLLPARGDLETRCDEQVFEKVTIYQWASPPAGSKPFCSGRFFQASMGIDGEYAHGLMRQAYRTGRRDLYEAALHHAYAMADLGVDHADFTHQIGGMPQGSISLALQRNLGMLAAYLETGDPYLLRVAESMADAAYAIDRSNWPRRSFGRDGAYIRSLTRLYDMTGQAFYLQRAGEALRRAAQCQRPNGSFADQGGTYGPHAHLNEIIKPWMCSILCEVMVDYLERAGSDEMLEACLVKAGNWLLSALQEDEHGKYWPFYIAWGRNEEDVIVRWNHPDQPPVRYPTGEQQLDYNARTLLWVSRHTGDPKYVRGWLATYERKSKICAKRTERYESVYGNTKIPDNFPWHEAHLWGARWDGEKVTLDPMLDLLGVEREAIVELPDGDKLRVRRTAGGIETEEVHDGR
jgi:hypothetical protein